MAKSTVTVPSEARDTGVSAYRWVVMLTWTGVHVWGYVLLETIGLFLPSMREDMGLSPVQEGWLSSSAMIGNLVLALPARLADVPLQPKVVEHSYILRRRSARGTSGLVARLPAC